MRDGLDGKEEDTWILVGRSNIDPGMEMGDGGGSGAFSALNPEFTAHAGPGGRTTPLLEEVSSVIVLPDPGRA